MRYVIGALKYAWALPNTMLGLSFIPLTLVTGGRVRVERGVIEIYGGFTRFFLARCLLIGAAAMCLGHAILGRDRDCLDRSRNHEHVHVRQYERWGPFMLPAYFLCSFLAWYRGEHFYLDNRFEREAYAVEGVSAARPSGSAVRAGQPRQCRCRTADARPADSRS